MASIGNQIGTMTGESGSTGRRALRAAIRRRMAEYLAQKRKGLHAEAAQGIAGVVRLAAFMQQSKKRTAAEQATRAPQPQMVDQSNVQGFDVNGQAIGPGLAPIVPPNIIRPPQSRYGDSAPDYDPETDPELDFLR